MTWIKKVDKECKCGHKLNPDHQNNKTFLGIKFSTGTKCNGHKTYVNVSVPCCCTKFLDRRFPTKFDTAMTVTCCIAIGLSVFTFGTMISILSIGLSCHTPQCNQVLDKPIWSVRDVGKILVPFLFLMIAWSVGWLLPGDYFRNKRRKIEPIDYNGLSRCYDCNSNYELSSLKKCDKCNKLICNICITAHDQECGWKK